MKSLNQYITEFVVKKHITQDYVDFNLPSGNLWAPCNIGADKPEDPGLLFQWGRIDGYKCDDKNHKFLTIDNYKTTSGKEYNRVKALDTKDDAAYQMSNGKCKIPTMADFDELFEHCDCKQHHNGVTVTSKTDNKLSIFIPATHIFGGVTRSYKKIPYIFLWSSSSSSNKRAFVCRIGDNKYLSRGGYSKYNATPIRAIKIK